MPGKRDQRTVVARVVGISGSPRRGGNTDTLLDKALEGARLGGAVSEKIFLNDLAFKPCQGCGGCLRTGICVIRDDMRHIYRAVENADSVIIASPVFFGTVTAQLKAMIDRFHSRWIAKYVLKKGPRGKRQRKGYFLSASDSPKRKYFVDARKIVRNFFATTDIEYAGELFCGGIKEKGVVKKDARSMEKAFGLGKAAVR